MNELKDRKIVVVNQTVNYLTVDICNAFAKKIKTVGLITGNVHEQERTLNKDIKVTYINKWNPSTFTKKFLSYLKASFSIFWLLRTKYKKHEVFFVSTPPMGYLINIILPNKFSILVWDVFPDGLKVTGISERNIIYKLWAYLNKRSFKKAYRIFTISNTMADFLSKYVPRDKLIITPIWSVFQNNEQVNKTENPFVNTHNLNNKFVVQYSGNIGLSHRVEHLVKMAELLTDQPHIFFQIIGRGPRVEHLKKLVNEKNLNNCQLLPFQSDEMFRFSLSAANLGVVILDEVSSKGSVPSKSYNLMSFGIPSIYIASKDSELADYIRRYKHGKCFSEDKLQQAALFVKKLSLDRAMQQEYRINSLEAGKNFKLSNADAIVEYYIKKG